MGDMMLIIINKIAVIFFALMAATGMIMVSLTPIVGALTDPVSAVTLLALGQLLALLGGAGWYCAEEDLHWLQWRARQR